MANWEVLNKELDSLLETMTDEDWKRWMQKRGAINKSRGLKLDILEARLDKALAETDFSKDKPKLCLADRNPKECSVSLHTQTGCETCYYNPQNRIK